MIYADGEFPQLVRLDRSVTNSYVLSTYKTSSNRFTIYKNNKAIGWASTELFAMQIHLMYLDRCKLRHPENFDLSLRQSAMLMPNILNRFMFTIPQIDFKALIEKQKSITFRSPREVNSYFYNCDKTIYPVFDSLFELEQGIKKLPIEEIKSTLAYLEKLPPLLPQFLDLLKETDFDCKNRDRINSMLEGIKDMLPGVIQRLQKRVSES